MVPRELEDLVYRELEPGEAIRWIDQPVPRVFSGQSIGAFVFAIPWTAFAIFWICGASGFRMPDFSRGGFAFFPLFGVPFVLVGLGMLSAPYWAYKAMLRTVYVITNRRAMTLVAGRTLKVESFLPHKLGDLRRTEHRDGTGDIVFADRVASSSASSSTQTRAIGFLSVRDPRAPEQLIRGLVHESLSGGSSR